MFPTPRPNTRQPAPKPGTGATPAIATDPQPNRVSSQMVSLTSAVSACVLLGAGLFIALAGAGCAGFVSLIHLCTRSLKC